MTQYPAMIMVKEVMMLFLVTGLGQKDVKLSMISSFLLEQPIFQTLRRFFVNEFLKYNALVLLQSSCALVSPIRAPTPIREQENIPYILLT